MIKSYLVVFESGGLHGAPQADLQRTSRATDEMTSSPSKQVIRPAASVLSREMAQWSTLSVPRRAKLARSTSVAPVMEQSTVLETPSPLESQHLENAHDRTVWESHPAQWPLQSRRASTVTWVEYDPVDAKRAARRRSGDSESLRGITRTQSFSVAVEDAKPYQPASNLPPLPRPASPVRTATIQRLEFEDVGELLRRPSWQMQVGRRKSSYV